MLTDEIKSGLIQDAIELHSKEYSDILIGFTMGRFFALPQNVKDSILRWLQSEGYKMIELHQLYLMILMYLPSYQPISYTI